MEILGNDHLASIEKIYEEECRICLRKTVETCSVFRDGDAIARQIMALASVQVKEGDGLPPIICLACNRLLQASYNLKLQIQSSDEKLRKSLKNKSDKKSLNSKNTVKAIIADVRKVDQEKNISEEASRVDGIHDEEEVPLIWRTSRLRCEQCTKIFCSKIALKRHIVRRHSKLTYNCTSCGKGFLRMDKLKDHEESKHNIEIFGSSEDDKENSFNVYKDCLERRKKDLQNRPTFASKTFNNFKTTPKENAHLKKPETSSQNASGKNRIPRSRASRMENLCNMEEIFLEEVQSNPSAVYQTVPSVNLTEEDTRLTKTQVRELADMTTEQTATLGPDGQFPLRSHEENSKCPADTYSNQKINILHDNNILCTKRNSRLATKKTLDFHNRMLHSSSRMCYFCPCCKNVFSKLSSVYRHLFKVHKKSTKEVQQLRSQIHENSYMLNSMENLDLEADDASGPSKDSTVGLDEIPTDMVSGVFDRLDTGEYPYNQNVVSAKNVNTESKDSEDDESSDPKDSLNNLLKNMNVSRGSGMDPDIRRMVMEVILGPTNDLVGNTTLSIEKNSTIPSSESTRKSESISAPETKGYHREETNHESISPKNLERDDAPELLQDPKDSFSKEESNSLKSTRSARSVGRPARRRIKTLNKDLIYDLEMAFRKSISIWNS